MLLPLLLLISYLLNMAVGKELRILFLLSMGLSPVMAYICNDDASLPSDAFEDHGCLCGTEQAAYTYSHLFVIYGEAFEGCHESPDDDGDLTIECAFLQDEAQSLNAALNRTLLSEIPVVTNGAQIYSKIRCLLLSGNNITSITYKQMRQFPNLKRLYVDSNIGIQFGPNVFADNPRLTVISLANNRLSEYPNLTSAMNLEEVNLENNEFTSVPDDFLISRLVKLNLKSTGLTEFPKNIGLAAKLKELLLGYNHISAIPDISNLTSLEILKLQNNQIQDLVPAHFRGLQRVSLIDLEYNKIEVLENFVFQDMCNLFTLDLQHNRIRRINERAFSGTNIYYLDLQHNRFSYLPSNDIRYSLKELDVKGCVNLIKFPRARNKDGDPTFPLIKKLTLEYQTHCCWYNDFYLHEEDDGIVFGRKRRQSICSEKPTKFVEAKNRTLVKCSPQPDAFHPCYDIIEFLYLRIAIWFVIIAAVVGNILVIAVLVFSMVKKTVTVPQILITNLAAADFCLAIYLIFIAAADLDTAGNYQNEAFNWERSAACKTAGFFAIFSSVASICILAVITLERLTTIAFSFAGRRFVTIPKAVVLLAIAWSIAFTFGILPAVGISSYGKVCICLPFEANTSLDKGYIISLLIFTGIVCFFILFCYIILFIQVKRTTSSLSRRQELRIAFRISALVVTDFIIWTPIAVIGLTGVLRGESWIDVQTSKYLMIFVFPINACVNPLLYSILQTAFHNHICDIFAQCGMCKEYNRRRKARALGVAHAKPSLGTKFGSITSLSTSLWALFSKQPASTSSSLENNEIIEMPSFTRHCHSNGSITSYQPSLQEVKYLSPIHEAMSPTQETEEPVTQELDTVFYSVPTNESSTAHLLSLCNGDSGTMLSNDNSDNGVTQSDQDDDATSNSSPPSPSKDQSEVIFNVAFSQYEESTDC